MSLLVADLACSRAGRALFAGVSIEMGPGSIAHVHGPNGSGKSSFLLAAAGILPPARGTVLWREEPVRSDIVAYAGHLDGLKPSLSLRENLEVWAGILGGDSAGVEDALHRLGIAHCADAEAGRCSAGQRRRAALARVRVAGRPLWLLDEPAATLDPAGLSVLEGLLKEHQEAGGVTLIATHAPLVPNPAHIIDIAQFPPAHPTRQDPSGWLP